MPLNLAGSLLLVNHIRTFVDNLLHERDRWLLWAPLAIGAGIILYFQLAVPTIDAAALEDCEHADIIIAPFLIRDCDAKKVIDDPELWHHGAHAIYFKRDGSMHVEYTRERRGMRPWSVGWKINAAD